MNSAKNLSLMFKLLTQAYVKYVKERITRKYVIKIAK